jgi:hypothetical protein
MKILSVIVLALNLFGLMMYPVVAGTPRPPIGIPSLVRRLAEISLLLPLIGRVLGWW